MIQPLWKMVWRFFKKLEIEAPYDPTIPLLGLYPAAAAAKWLQSCLTLCDPIDGSPPGSSVPGILQARTLEWIAISFSRLYPEGTKIEKYFSILYPIVHRSTIYNKLELGSNLDVYQQMNVC